MINTHHEFAQAYKTLVYEEQLDRDKIEPYLAGLFRINRLEILIFLETCLLESF
jgi:hypothetical protein